MNTLRWTAKAQASYEELQSSPALNIQFKAVRKCLKFMQSDLRHPGLQTHKFHSLKCPHGGDLFEAYAQNQTPGAWRLFFCYVPKERETLLVVAITPHP